jgi:peptidoglycan/LPS O-acetylase OafA/YrhL
VSSIAVVRIADAPVKSDFGTGVASGGGAEIARLDALTSIRFFAAMYVVVFHSRDLFSSWPHAVRNIVGSGNVAVGLFFILSGFVLAYTYSDGWGSFRGTRRAFWVARLARIYPLYLIAFVLFFPAAVIKPGPHPLGTGILTISMLQGWTPLRWWNEPGWSLSVEAFCYATFPALILLIRRVRGHWLLLVMAAAWVVDLGIALCYSGRAEWFFRYSPVARFPEFVMGIALGKFFCERRTSFGMLFAISGAGISLAVLMLANLFPAIALHNGLLAPAFGLMIYGLACNDCGLSNSWLIRLGDASYGVYILQTPVWIWLKALVGLFTRSNLNASALFFVVYALVLIIVCLLAARFFEFPLRRVIREKLA